MFSATLRLLVEIVGDKPVIAVTRQDCRRFRDTMARLPPNMTKRFRGCTVAEVLAKGAPPMSAKTVNKNLSAVTGLFAWCEREGLIDASPARGLLLHREGRADLERDAFGPDELRLIFGALTPAMGARYWLPLIALYDRMRKSAKSISRQIPTEAFGEFVDLLWGRCCKLVRPTYGRCRMK